ncbi:MAG: DUF4326 domain-containing protein [Rhodospirillaceae bacterium]
MPVMNRHTEREFIEENAVPITRPGPWGNPFVIGRDGDREAVIARYRSWLWESIRTGVVRLEDLAALHGCQLVCVCKPLSCHGDVLEAAAAWAAGEGGADRNFADRQSEGRDRIPTKP